MLTRFEYDVNTLREMLHAGSDALTVIEKSKEGLTSYGKGMRDTYEHVIEYLDRILKEVSE